MTDEIQKTSFGKLQVLKRVGDKPLIEHLVFEKEGRPHRHNETEIFVVISGSGIVYRGKEEVAVGPGDQVEIPPKSLHWMKPSEGQILEGFLWYQVVPLNISQTNNL